jgi:Uma2 family endonuclease
LHTQHAFTPEEYQRLEKVGIIQPSPRNEFRDGQIYQGPGREIRLFTTDEYFRMAELEILPSNSRTELRDGQIFEMSPSNPPHDGTIEGLTPLFVSLYSEVAGIRIQLSLAIPDRNARLPDVAIVRRREASRTKSHPEPHDVYLIVEVSDSTIKPDMEGKALIYAKAGIKEYWIIDIQSDRLIVHRKPTSSGYTDVKPRSSGQIAALEFPHIKIEVDDLLKDCVKRSIQPPKPKGSRKR